MRGPLDESAAKYKITNPSKVISTDNFTRVSYDPGGTKPKLKVEIFGRKGKPLQGTTLEL